MVGFLELMLLSSLTEVKWEWDFEGVLELGCVDFLMILLRLGFLDLDLSRGFSVFLRSEIVIGRTL